MSALRCTCHSGCLDLDIVHRKWVPRFCLRRDCRLFLLKSQNQIAWHLPQRSGAATSNGNWLRYVCVSLEGFDPKRMKYYVCSTQSCTGFWLRQGFGQKILFFVSIGNLVRKIHANINAELDLVQDPNRVYAIWR